MIKLISLKVGAECKQITGALTLTQKDKFSIERLEIKKKHCSHVRVSDNNNFTNKSMDTNDCRRRPRICWNRN